MSTAFAYPLNVPVINYNNINADIVIKYKYTYVSFASYTNFTATQNTGAKGFVTLNPNL
jgi:hypothetical protein